MAAQAPLYDLVVLLDSAADDDRRAQILRGVEEAVVSDGEVVNRQDWGMRALSYEIAHKTDADYHLLQFHASADVLRQLDRTLRITDEVMRFRIIKLAPGTPPPPEHRPEPRPAEAGVDGTDAAGFADGDGAPTAAEAARDADGALAAEAGDDTEVAPAAEVADDAEATPEAAASPTAEPPEAEASPAAAEPAEADAPPAADADAPPADAEAPADDASPADEPTADADASATAPTDE